MNSAPQWLLMIASLPTRPAAARMRLWRGVKLLGCAALREGAYLMPAVPAAAKLARLAEEVSAAGGSAEILRIEAVDEAQSGRFRSLFDRGADYARLLEANAVKRADEKRLRVMRREFSAIAAMDYFPGEAKRQAEAALAALEALASGEPSAGAGVVRRLERKDYQGRVWATRRHLWVDRMASAWLIRRYIDKKARFLWLDDPKRCPKQALGFDFDGAAFTHAGSMVSFEVLVASFGLQSDAALMRLGELVHCLDVGGLPVAEAPGVEALLAGLRAAQADDDKLFAEAAKIFDWLLQNYKEKNSD